MTTAATLEIAVIVIDRAVSPRAKCVIRFARMPPGEAPSRTSPTANAGSRLNASAIANARSGESTRRLRSPIATPRGCSTTRLKSASVSDMPRLTMITAKAIGSTAVEKIESSMTATEP